MNGRVTLLGAGPGDPELLTLIGKRRLSEADVVLYDRLIDPSLLAFTAENAELVDVGKLPQHHKVKQSKINEMLVDYAQNGKKVVRLKAGDPYVFGRGGEEAQVLEQHGVNFEVIPGITSAIAGLAAVGIPITHRDFASSFHIITGHHKKNGQKQLDWENIAHQEGTIVFLMGMAQLPNICQQLVAHGKDRQTPVAIIQWATQWRQKMVTGDLTNINGRVKEHHLSSPALIVVGDVVRLSAQLNVRQPLQGVHVLLPYSKRQRLFNKLVDRGATADFYQRAVKEPQTADLTLLADVSTLLVDNLAAYRQFIAQLVNGGKDLRSLAGKKVIALNRVVARHLRKAGIIVDGTLPEAELPADFAEIGGETPVKNGKVFLSFYQKAQQKLSLPFELAEFNAVIFPSTDSLADFIRALSKEQRTQLAALTAFTMGPTISKAARQFGFKKVVECQPNIDKTVKKIEEAFAND
jgi:uroporphyrinogen III methyltransferase/synthase